LEPIDPIQWVIGLFLGVKQLELEVKHSTPSGAEVKNEGSCTFAPPI
jgi:hypothetical protein